MPGAGKARIVVVGLGPAGPETVPAAATAVLRGASARYLRTGRHPSAAALVAEVEADGGCPVETFDERYESAGTFGEVYAGIVEALVAAAQAAAPDGYVAYAVPGSPQVAERTVELLRADARVAVEVVPAPSFLDLVWDRLGVDPLAVGVRLVDATTFATGAAGERGPLLVAQCHSREVLSSVKLAVDEGLTAADSIGLTAIVLHHLGLPDEEVREVPWAELDRSFPPDHLTSVWIPRLAAPVAGELAALDELVRVLRARCPWDARQTHGSLARHLQEEAYETLEAIGALSAGEPDPTEEAIGHLEEELGDLLFQVFFHAALAAEAGRFTVADVARGVHDKLIGRHPHVFGDTVAETPEAVAANWERSKQAEKGRASIFEGIPAALPALALAAKLQRKVQALGVDLPGLEERLVALTGDLAALADMAVGSGAGPGGSGETLEGTPATEAAVGALLFALADVARRLGVDPESALRAEAGRFRSQHDHVE